MSSASVSTPSRLASLMSCACVVRSAAARSSCVACSSRSLISIISSCGTKQYEQYGWYQQYEQYGWCQQYKRCMSYKQRGNVDGGWESPAVQDIRLPMQY